MGINLGQLLVLGSGCVYAGHMTTTEDDIRRGKGRAFVLASFFAEAMCNRHADLYIQWYCCTSARRETVCAILRRTCIVERYGCSDKCDR